MTAADLGDRVRRVPTAAEIALASGDHPFTRFDLARTFRPPGLALRGSHAVAWAQVWADGRTGVVVLGEDDAVAALVRDEGTAAWVRETAPDHVTAPVTAYGVVQQHLGLRGGNAWDRMWTTTAPPRSAAEDLVDWVVGDGDALTAFVRSHNPRPHALPGQHAGQRWATVRDGGRIVACGCTEPGNTGVALLGGIVVDDSLRGRGLGTAVTAFLTRDALRRTGASTLGVFADNDRARVLYERMGYRVSLRARTGFPVPRSRTAAVSG